jgi:hypothetical protein
MNSTHSRFVGFVVFILLLVGGISQAQEIKMVAANIPFEFSVGKSTFPAGKYQVLRVDAHRLSLRDEDGRVLLTLMPNTVESVSAPSATKLTFKRTTTGYVLSQVWVEGDRYGQQLPQAKSPALAAKRQKPQEVSVVAGRP